MARGYEVLDRNWRAGRDGELDLVLRRDRWLVVCEVKTRTTSAFGAPVEAVTLDKQARLRRLAARWLREHAPLARGCELRFDVVSVLGGDVAVVENAF